MFVDSHCHLDFPAFDHERAAIVERAFAAGIQALLTIGTHLSRREHVHKLTQQFSQVFCALGIHPHYCCQEYHADVLSLLMTCVHQSNVVAIGETGLDYHYNNSDPETQRASFRTHIRASLETQYPLVIHSRNAEHDILRIIHEELPGTTPFHGVLHCFTGSQKFADLALEKGLYLSFSGILTFPKSTQLRHIAKSVPLDRLLLETDAPYLSPVPYRGKRNEPSYLIYTAQTLAHIHQISLENLAQYTTQNFYSLFQRTQQRT